MEYIFAAFAFVLGACIGSFLNVCIYRMPREIPVARPRRSFCPSCKYQIPWYSNLPLITWLAQRGKCANCGGGISFRYFGVELFTGLLYLAVWWRVGLMDLDGDVEKQCSLAFALWILVSLLVSATFIDFEHFIIPDAITWGGAAAGLVLSTVVPQLHDTHLHLRGLTLSLLGAGAGFGLLWLVSVWGKAAFGRKKDIYNPPVEFTWKPRNESAELCVGGEPKEWMDLFTTEKDFLMMECSKFEFNGEKYENIEIRCQYERLYVMEKEYDLNKVESFSGTVKLLKFQRDAMGFGDVKFMACIGAFLGWKAIIATVFIASVVGAGVGLVTIALGRRDWSAKIPFGPYLALGSLVWVFVGPQLLGWWLSSFAPAM